MDSRIRTFAFAILLIGISSVVLVYQSIQTSAASIRQRGAVASALPNALIPVQSANSTVSSQAISANSTSSPNSTAAQQTTSAVQNETTAISYLQYQMTSMNAELLAMSSSMSSINQQTGTVMLVAEAGLIVAILAVIAAIAVARRADAMYNQTSPSQAAGPPPAK